MPSFKVIPDREAWGIGDYAAQEAVRTLFQGSVMTQQYGPGEILYASAPDTLETLTPGDPGDLMQVDSEGFPEWTDVLTGNYTFQGDIIFNGALQIDSWDEGSIGYTDADSIFTELPHGAIGDVLGMNAGGTLPEWRTPSSYLSHTLLDGAYHTDTLAGPPPVVGDIIVAPIPGFWSALPVGAVGAPLVVNPAGLPAWLPPVVPGGILHWNLLATETLFTTTMTYDDVNRVMSFLGGNSTIYGSDQSLGELTLQATTNANLGFINMNSPVIFGPYTSNPGAAYGFDYSVTEAITAAFIGGGLNFSGDISFTNGTFIYESFRGAPTIQTGVNPGFAAYTVLQALPLLRAGSGAGHNPIAPLVLNAGPTVENGFVGTRTTTTMGAVNFAGQIRTTVSGATMNVTNWTGFIMAPKYSTVAGSTINFGTIRGLHAQVPAAGLFQPGSGVENMTAYYALDVDNIGAFGGTAQVAAVRSAITNGPNQFFLLNNGNANSDHGAGHMYFDDNFGIAYGGVGVSNFDSWVSWNGAGNYHRTYFVANASALRWSNPGTNRFLFDNDGGNTSGEYNFNCFKFSLGAQTGAVGNQVGVFVAPTRTTGIAGGWSDFLLTQAGNLTVNHAMSQVFGWTINGPSMTLGGGGSVTDAGALLVGGNVNQGTNRYGVYILSNPSGGTLNYSLRTAGATRVDGTLEFNARLDANTTTVTGTTHTAAAEHVILVDDDTAGSAVTVTLPTAATAETIYHIKKLGTTANVIVDGNGAETVDGAANATLTAQYESIMVVSDGTEWWII